MRKLIRLGVLAMSFDSFGLGVTAATDLDQTVGAFEYPRLVLHGKLAQTFVIDRCEYISGMICRITLKKGAALPSQVFFTEHDSAGRKVGARVRLIYPKLNAGKSGKATFHLRSSTPSKLVLRGEWKGPWKDPY